jgi:hypothetical protein
MPAAMHSLRSSANAFAVSFGGDADSGVLHLEAQRDVAFGQLERESAGKDLTAFRKFDGVAEQVEQNLP